MLLSNRAWLVPHNLRNDSGRNFYSFKQCAKETAQTFQGQRREDGIAQYNPDMLNARLFKPP